MVFGPAGEIMILRHFQLQHHDRDDDGEHAESQLAVLSGHSWRSRVNAWHAGAFRSR